MASKKRTETQPVSAARLCSSVLLCTQAEGTRTVLTCEGFRLAAQFTPAAVTTASKTNSTSIDIVSVNRINQSLHSNACNVSIRKVSKLFSDIRTKILTNRLNHFFVINCSKLWDMGSNRFFRQWLHSFCGDKGILLHTKYFSPLNGKKKKIKCVGFSSKSESMNANLSASLKNLP